MTLSQTIRHIEAVAASQPAVNSVVRNDIFRLNTLLNAKYGVFGWTQGQHTAAVDSSLITYNFTFFYVDRLTHDRANQVEVQSVGVMVLDNVIRTLEKLDIIAPAPYTFTTFNQRFLDDCAGVYVQVGLQVPAASVCGEEYPDFNDDFNEDFFTDIY